MVQVMRDDNDACWPYLRSIDLAGNSLANMGVDRAADIVTLLLQRNPRLERVSVLGMLVKSHISSFALKFCLLFRRLII